MQTRATIRNLCFGLVSSLALFGQSQVQTVAGGALPNRIAGTSAAIGYPISVAVDGAGNCYIGTGGGDFSGYADSLGLGYYFAQGPVAVYRLDKSGQITLIAGNGFSGTSGDDGPATSAGIEVPVGLAVNRAGTALYIASPTRVRRVDLTTGTITSFAGTGQEGFGGDKGPAVNATFKGISSVTLDGTGNLLIAAYFNSNQGGTAIRRVDATTGIITTVAVIDVSPGSTAAPFAADAAGTFYVGGPYSLLTKVSSGTTTTIGIDAPVVGLAVDATGKLYIIAEDHTVRILNSGAGGTTTIIAGVPKMAGYAGDGKAASAVLLANPVAVAVDTSGSVFIADTGNGRVRRLNAGTIQTVAGNGVGTPDGAQAATATLLNPAGLAIDSARRNLYFCEAGAFRLRGLDLGTNLLRTLTGTGAYGLAPDGSKASGSPMPDCGVVALDALGTLYFTTQAPGPPGPYRSGVNILRRFPSAGGVLNSFPGQLYSTPTSLAIDPGGTIYVGETYSVETGRSTGVAMSPVTLDKSWTGPFATALDRSGNMYVAAAGSNRVYRIAAPGGTAQAVAGTGNPGYSGDGGAALSAQLNSPAAVAVDAAGNLFIADTGNHAIRRVEANTGTIVTLSGNGTAAFMADGPAAQNAFASPRFLALDPAGDLYVSDDTHRVRRITLAGAPRLTVDNATLAFAAQIGSPAPAAQPVKVGSSGAAVSFTATPSASWISVTPASGNSGGPIGIAVNLAGLTTAGPYTGSVVISSTGALNSVTIAVTLNLAAGAKDPLAVTPLSMAFSYNLGDDPPNPQTLSVTSTAGNSLAFTAAVSVDTDVAWLQVDADSGTAPASIQVSVTNLDMLDPGTYQGTIVVSAPAANPASQTVAVQLQIVDPNAGSRPSMRRRLR